MELEDRNTRSVFGDYISIYDIQRAVEDKATVPIYYESRLAKLYNEIVRLRPAWHDDDDDKGEIKVVMTGSASDPPEWQPHIRSKPRREFLAKRFRDPADPFKLVIVRDMWLTGFDAPACIPSTWTSRCARTG